MAEFPNPQQQHQEPGTERRLLLAFTLTFLIIIGSQWLIKKYYPQPAQPEPTPAQTAPTPQPNPAAGTAAPAVAAPASVPSKQASAEREIVVENGLYRIRFSNRGGVVKSWVLKKFDDDKGQPLELINAASEKWGFPLSLYTYDEGLRQKLASALYVTTDSNTLNAPADITFEFADAEVVARKTFHFDHSYAVRIEASVRYKGADVQAYPSWPASFGDETAASAYAAQQVEYQLSDKIERLAAKKVSGGNTLTGPLYWAGPTERYFAAVFLPDDPQNAAMVTLHHQLDAPRDAAKPNDTVKVSLLGAAVGDRRGPTVERIYVGPRAIDTLKEIPVSTSLGQKRDLSGLVNFGFFEIIAKPLFYWLRWTYNTMVHNWGWAIVLQTIIINLVLLPLRLPQMKSGLKMQKLAPQIKAINKKYEKYGMRDTEKQQEKQRETMALYKREGVNPVGGCLPMLIQMPFLFAYYSMLGAVIDLRHAPWAYIRDLSSPDPWYLLPIGIVATMFVVQRMTPQGMVDPAQQKMMNIFMPMMLGFVSLNLAAGLCLYWSVGNLISIVTQLAMNRTELGREVRELHAKREARKKDK